MTVSAVSTVPTMRFPWQRLRADRRTSDSVVLLVIALLLGFFTYSTLIQFSSEWQLGSAVSGGLIVPALATLLVIAPPTRYRMHGLAMRHWTLDHGLLVALVLVSHLIFPVVAMVTPFDLAAKVPAWALLLPVIGIAAVVAVLLWRYRGMLTGRLVATGGTGSGTPLYYRVFLARRGPAAWRVVYQPIGLVVLLASAVAIIVQSDGDTPVPEAGGIMSLCALVTAPVVAASRQTSLAVGMPRRAWFRHVIAAFTGPLVVISMALILIAAAPGLPGELRQIQFRLEGDPFPTVQLIMFCVIAVVTVLACAGLSVSISSEDWGTAIMWWFFFGIILAFAYNVYFDATSSLWSSLIVLTLAALVAWALVSYARTKSIEGRPSWSVTSLIGGARRAGN